MVNVPNHIGLVLDGNRRFAKRLMLKPWKGHEWGAQKVEKLVEWCEELNIKELTLYVFSLKNFNRPKKEFIYLMDLFTDFFSKPELIERIHKNKIRINFIGRLNLLPENLQKLMKNLADSTSNYKGYTMNFAMAYDGRAEVIDATKKIAEQVKEGKLNLDQITEEVFSKNVYLESKPDLIIRTSGEKRTSGFLLWQGDYAEWYFLDKFWPEFEKEDLIKAINDFKNRERRFGK